MTEEKTDNFFVVFSAEYHDVVRRLDINDPSSLASSTAGEYFPCRQIGTYQDVRSLIKLVDIDDDAREFAKSLQPLTHNPDLGELLDFNAFVLVCAAGETATVELVSVNKPFKVRMINNVFVGSSVFELHNSDEYKNVQFLNLVGSVICSLDGSVVAVVVRTSGNRLFAAELDESFKLEWRFERPEDSSVSLDMQDELFALQSQVAFSVGKAEHQ